MLLALAGYLLPGRGDLVVWRAMGTDVSQPFATTTTPGVLATVGLGVLAATGFAAVLSDRLRSPTGRRLGFAWTFGASAAGAAVTLAQDEGNAAGGALVALVLLRLLAFDRYLEPRRSPIPRTPVTRACVFSAVVIAAALVVAGTLADPLTANPGRSPQANLAPASAKHRAANGAAGARLYSTGLQNAGPLDVRILAVRSAGPTPYRVIRPPHRPFTPISVRAGDSAELRLRVVPTCAPRETPMRVAVDFASAGRRRTTEVVLPAPDDGVGC